MVETDWQEDDSQIVSTTRASDSGHSTADSAHQLWAAVAGRKGGEDKERLFGLSFRAEVQSKTSAFE